MHPARASCLHEVTLEANAILLVNKKVFNSFAIFMTQINAWMDERGHLRNDEKESEMMQKQRQMANDICDKLSASWDTFNVIKNQVKCRVHFRLYFEN